MKSLACRCALAMFFCLMTVAAAMADVVVRDSADVRFRQSSWQIELGYDDNGVRLDSLLKAIRAIQSYGAPMQLKSARVTGTASPEGSADFNYRLSKLRAEAIFDFISKRENLPDSITEFHFGGSDWTGLKSLVEADSKVPYKAEVLRELDRIITANGGSESERQKYVGALKRIGGGEAYRYMYRNLFSALRKSTILLEYESTGLPTGLTEAEEILEETSTEEVITYTPARQETALPEPMRLTRERFALKTNMLYDALLMPNLELEWRFSKNWSVAVEGNVAWWSNDSKHKKYRLSMFSPEVRRWFKVHDPWHGLFVGAFAGGGLYDLENGGTGYKGEGGMAGLSLGYMWPISKHLSLEASVGAGYMLTRYKEYLPFEGHYLYQRTKTMNYFGPLKLKLSLVWRIAETIKQKQTDSAE